MGARKEDERQARELKWVLSGSALALYVGMRWGMLAESHRDVAEGLAESLSADLALDILARPLALSLGTVPVLCGISLFCCVWGAYVYVLNGRTDVRHGDEYGTARKGTVREGQAYRDPKDPDNNIVLTKNLGIAIRPNAGVRRKVTARNICVLGGTGANKTTGFVMPNLLQLRANRDVVVIDPKGTTLATCGHALLSSGIDVNVFNTVDTSMSDLYNPLASIRTHAEVIDFVTCLIKNTNNGRESSDPIWDNGEALFYRAILTLLLDWYDEEDMTFANMVMLADMADIPDEGEGGKKSPLDLIFEQIETGWRWVDDDSDTDDASGGAFDPVRAGGSGRVVRLPSLYRRRDGVIPALVTRPGGGHGLSPDQDEALKVWHEFRHGAGKTLKSFVISSHTRLAYLSTPEVLRILSSEDGRDEIHLERLGQVEDEWGRPLRPRVIFVISSDFNDNLNALLSIMMWQAIYLPMSTADTRNAGRLPRPVSLIFDEFRNIGKLGSFIQTIAVVRSRNIDVAIMLQTASQLEEVYGKEGAATIRGNCATTLYLGGGHDTATAKAISEEIGKATVYKDDWSRQGSGLSATSSRQRSSLARDVYDPNEVATLPATRALVMIGQEQVIEDDKSLVWEHRNYDPTYMAEDPERRFDYKAWKAAGRPMDDALARWEEAWFADELPARTTLERLERQLARARHEEATEEASVTHRAHRRYLEARVDVARARLSLAHARACQEAGLPTDGLATLEARLDVIRRKEQKVEAGLRAETDPADWPRVFEVFE
jgi:type IV secretion system protein VirD4